MLAKFFAPLGVKMAGAGIVVLMVIILVMSNHNKRLVSENNELQARLQSEQVRHGMTRKSYEMLESDLEYIRQEAAVREAELRKRELQARAREGELDEREKSTDKLIARMQSVVNDGACKAAIPAELRKMLRGL